MKRVYPLFGVLALIVLGAAWQIFSLFYDNYPITNFPPSGRTVVAFGDSLTVGVGASLPESSYVNILAGRLNAPIINKGVSGETTRDALLRIESDVIALKPDVVIVLFGGNDYLKRVPQEETFANLRTIIDRLQKEGIVVLLVGVRGGLLHDKFDNDFARLARETGSVFVANVLDGVIGDTKYVIDDGIHPNDAGYLKMADKIAPALESIIGIK
jgi:acyl-CoA thioesterase I